MKKFKWNRKLSILVLIMFVTVTFASFNTNLFINGNAYVRVDRDIRITNIHLLESEYNGYENTNSEYTNRTISMDVSLPRQASSLTYEVTISNVSDRRYKISDIIEDAYDNRDVKYELIDASIGNIVEPHTEKTFKVKFTNNVTVVEEEDVYQTLTYTFDYTGGEQEFVVPYDGDYTLEVWGAQGGSASTIGGYGAYSKGVITLNKNSKLYINVGGTTSTSTGGYNGGGSALYGDSYGGGGATHIASISGKLSSLNKYKGSIIDDSYYDSSIIYIVAGGGGGTTRKQVYRGGSGGGLAGVNGIPETCVNDVETCGGTGATQTNSGKCRDHNWCDFGSFGQGGSSKWKGTSGYQSTSSTGGGGGGGLFGGGSGVGGGCYGTGAGGSGYIASSKLSNKEMYCYQCQESNEVATKTVTTDNHSSTATSQYAKEGNGYAKLTLTRKIEDGSEYDFDYTGGQQTFNVPYSGIYQLETWGAQGSTYVNGIGGYGGYSKGNVSLNKNETLYINVGGKSIDKPYGKQQVVTGGYNGGGSSGDSGGGGATHIATRTGLLSTLENFKSDILIVSGGGGGGERTAGGAGGGYIGNTGNFGYANAHLSGATGGSQINGGVGSIVNPEAAAYTNHGDGDSGSFGQGAVSCLTDTCGAGAGGGGYYGGGSSHYASGGGGGSGYIANQRLTEKIMYCYKCQESQEPDIKTVKTNSHSATARVNQAKEGNGYSRITLLKRTINRTKLTLDFTFEEYVNENEYTYGFTGTPQTFTVPKTGYYQIELWGASGDNHRNDYVEEHQSFAGYTSGKIKLNKGETLYVYVGGEENNFNSTQATNCKISGGATDVRLKMGENWYDLDSLSSRIMVAGGAGGTYGDNSASPSLGAGGLSSYKSTNFSSSVATTQTSGGIGVTRIGDNYSYHGVSGSFGEGGTARNQIEEYISIRSGINFYAGAGGYYGGQGDPSGGSGSSFISGHNGCVAITAESDTTPRNDSNGNQCTDGTTDITCSKHYSNYVFTDTRMVDGKGYEWTTQVGTEVVGMPTHDGTSTMTGNDGDGFAKITCLEEITDYSYDYTGDVQEFVAPYKGIYKVELWGAGGGDLNVEDVFTKGGSGSYTSGTITLNKNEKLNIYVGEKLNQQEDRYTFNGGGRASISTTEISSEGANGGGATDIRIVNGSWDDFDSLKSRIMVAAGGAAASQWGATNDVTHRYYFPGGAGGGLIGYSGTAQNFSPAVGATQLRGGLAATANGPTSSTYPVGGQFGKGGFGSKYSYTYNYGGGGGSGLFGGASGTAASMAVGSGSGGSSYISGHQGCVSIAESSTSENITFINDSSEIACNDATSQGYNSSGYNTDKECSNHYSGKVFTNTIMIDGKGYAWDSNGVGNTIVGMPSKDGRTTMTGNTGNGFARITLVEKIDTYKVNYDLDGGTIEKPRKSYSYYDDNITLKTPTKSGYTFTGWTGGKNLLDYTKPFTNGNSIVDSNGNISSKNLISDGRGWGYANSADFYQTLPAGKYFLTMTFSVPPSNSTAQQSSRMQIYTTNEDTSQKTLLYVLQYMYNYNEVKIPFELTQEETIGIQVKAYNGVYKIQVEQGEEATQWEPYISTPIENITIPSRSKGNRIYHANWVKEYKINYVLAGGSITGKRTIYTQLSSSYTIPNPIRDEYTFLGWTGGKNLFDKSGFLNMSDYTIDGGHGYMVKPIALNKDKKYAITVRRYNGFDGNVGSSSYFLLDCMSYGNACWTAIAHPTQPNYSSSNFVYSPDDNGNLYISRTGITQEQLDTIWSNTDLQIEEGDHVTPFEQYISSPTKNITIPAGSKGNRTYTANWIKNYQIDVNHFEDGDWIDRTGASDSRYTNLKFDVYINGQLKASQVNDYNQRFDEGTTYEITNFTYDTNAFDLIIGSGVNTGTTNFSFNNPTSGTLSQSLVNMETSNIKINIELRAKS